MVAKSYTIPIQRQDPIMEATFRNAKVIILKLILDITFNLHWTLQEYIWHFLS